MKLIKYTFIYFVYFLLTIDARNRYFIGKKTGKHCWKISGGLTYFVPLFNNQEPYREFFTWREYRKRYDF